MLLGSQLFEHVFYNISPTLNHDSFSFAGDSFCCVF